MNTNTNTTDYDHTTPAAPRRNDAAYTDGRTHRTKTHVPPSLDVPTAAQRWRDESERVRLAFSKVRHRLTEAVAEDTTTVEMVLSDALGQATRKEQIDPALLARVIDAQERTERAATARVALATLDRMHAGELGARFAEIADELRELVADDVRAVLADAVRLTHALDGVTTPEAAMSAGLSALWLERVELAGRWMACQRSRVWLERATRDGFEALPGSRVDRFRDGTAGATTGVDIWRNQFADHHTRDTDDAAGVLSWYVAEINDGEHPEALV
ncbi:hypothetical protein AB0L62_17730 [Nocardia asteroides]|uniref:hypothetical protein n=1 Tax=Nocardia asteroides TaxID=1824 RepID=UPI00343239C7